MAQETLKNLVDKSIKGIKLSILRSIDLSEVVLDKNQILSLSDAIKTSKTVIFLDLSKVKLGNGGVNLLCSGLVENQSISSLKINKTGITTEGFKSISKMLKVNKTLQSLDVSFNSITDQAANYLAEALLLNESISSLVCFSCNLSSDSVNSMVHSFSQTDRLFLVSFEANRIYDSSMKAISEWIKKSTFLNTLNLAQNHITAVCFFLPLPLPFPFPSLPFSVLLSLPSLYLSSPFSLSISTFYSFYIYI